MKKFYLPLLLAATSLPAVFAQQNMQLVSQFDYVSLGNDIWGYAAPDGTEYALAGLRAGVSVVSLADPANPVEIQFIPGGNSTWRDLKTWRHHAYVTTDQPGTKDGLLVIDLSGLPGGVTWHNWTPLLADFNDTLFTCHNLYVDEFGYAYLSGCNVNSGGVIFVDMASQPGSPQYAGKCAPTYSHDSYTRANLLYSSEIYAGQFAAYDVADKSSPTLLATQPTPSAFTHNSWLSDDGGTLFTTDERPNAPTAAYDVSDLSDIRFLDAFNPPATLNMGVIPHNTHIFNDFMVISHYGEGCVVVDASRPQNLVQVGQYDTSPDFVGGFHGAWGAYPFLPSGLVLAMDIENGLFVLQPAYKRACFLEGKVTDAVTGAALKDVRVEIQSSDPNAAFSDAFGGYRTGQPTPGGFEVVFRAKGYFDETAEATLASGEVTLLDVQLTPLPAFEMSGKVVEKLTGMPVAGAFILLENHDFTYTDTTDAGGSFTLPVVTQGDYVLHTGKWGWENAHLENLPAETAPLLVELAQAYQDNFNLDLGWTVSGDAQDGVRERGVPKETRSGSEIFNPGSDSPADFGERAHVTGNQGFSVNDDDVDKGATLLASPPMQLRSRHNRPMLTFDWWFYNASTATPADDSLTVLASNGKASAVVAVIRENAQEWRQAAPADLASFLEITDEMRITFRTADAEPTYHFLEAGIDNFRISEGLPDDAFHHSDDLVKMRVFPNPFLSELTVDYKVERSFKTLKLLLFNALGQVVEERPLSAALGTVSFSTDLVPGVYVAAFLLDERLSEGLRVVKGR